MKKKQMWASIFEDALYMGFVPGTIGDFLRLVVHLDGTHQHCVHELWRADCA